MNLGEIYRRVKRLIGDDMGLLVTEQDIVDWVNEAQNRIAVKTKILQEVTTINTVVGTDEYTLETDFLSIDRVTYNGIKLAPSSLKEIDVAYPNRDSLNQTGIPTHFYVWDRNFYLYPNPSEVGVVRVWQNILPANIAVYDAIATLDIPAHFHDAVVAFCLARAKERDEDYGASERFESKFASDLDDISAEDQNVNEESYPTVRVVGDDV